MARSASSSTAALNLLQIKSRSRSNPVAKVQYYKNGSWQDAKDVINLSFSQSFRNQQVGKFLIVPPAQTMSTTWDNANSQYTPEGTGSYADVIKRNLPLRGSLGYKLDTPVAQTYSLPVSNSYEKYKTQTVGAKIYNDVSNTNSVTAYSGFTISPLYTSQTYSDGTYAPEAYYISNAIDFESSSGVSITGLSVDSDTNKIDFYYRASNTESDLNGTALAFTSLGSAVNGTKSFSFSVSERYFQIAIVWRTGVWSTSSGYVENISIGYTDSREFFSFGEFPLDKASFQPSFESKKVTLTGRDSLKYAIEKKISTSDYTSTDVAQIIRDVAERAGLETNDGVVEYVSDTGYTVSISGYVDTKAIDALNEAMLYLISKNENYFLYINDDNYLTLDIPQTTTDEFNHIFNSKSDIDSLSKELSSDDLLQKVSIRSTDTDAEKNAESVLASATYTSAGVKTLSWASDATNPRPEVTLNTSTTTYDYGAITPTSFEITIGGTNPNISITIYGNEISGSYSGYIGEAINQTNFDAGAGRTLDLVNRFVQNNAEAQTMAQKIIERFPATISNFEWRVNFSGNAYPLVQVGDRIIVLEETTLTNHIYLVENIRYSYTGKGAAFKMSIGAKDLGATLEDTIYDRFLATAAEDLLYADGLYYDMDLWTLDEDTTTYRKAQKL